MPEKSKCQKCGRMTEIKTCTGCGAKMCDECNHGREPCSSCGHPRK